MGNRPNYLIGQPNFERTDNYWKCKLPFNQMGSKAEQKIILTGYGKTKIEAFQDALWLKIDLRE